MMVGDPNLGQLADMLRSSRGITAKADISIAAARLGLSGTLNVPVGDDCAAIPDGDGFTLLAIEGFMNEFVAGDPWFAGWCGVMVNISDIAAMGGRPVAVVNALWADGAENASAIFDGMKAASERFGVPIVGGHTNLKTDRSQLSVAILGKAKQLLTSFNARPGDRLIAAIDLRGSYREPFSNWQAAIDAPAWRLRGDLELLPIIVEAGLSCTAKDISQGGIVGTALMLAECSGLAITIDVTAVPKPDGVPLDRWLLSFPSFGYLIAAPKGNIAEILRLFKARDIAAADIGEIASGTTVSITDGRETKTVWDWADKPLLGFAPVVVDA